MVTIKAILNKYAIRNGKLVNAKQLSRTFERGLNSRCTCPNCGANLSARFPEDKTPHFVHPKEACDKNEYLLSVLYYALRDTIEEKEVFYTPKLYATYKFLPKETEVLRKTVQKNVKLYEQDGEKREKITDESWNHCGATRFYYDSDGKIIALIANWKNYKYNFAIVIDSEKRIQKDLAIPSQNVLFIDVDSLEIDEKTNLENIKFMLRGSKIKKKWLEHYKLERFVDDCVIRQTKWNRKQDLEK